MKTNEIYSGWQTVNSISEWFWFLTQGGLNPWKISWNHILNQHG